LALGVALPCAAQTVELDDPRLDYLRLLQISGAPVPGSLTVLPAALEPAPGSELFAGPWSARGGTEEEPSEGAVAGRLGARLRLFSNSRHPTGQNDGVVWQGKGWTTALDFGGAVVWRGLSVSVRPTLVYTQNAAFPLAPVAVSGQPEWAYPWRRVDLPQRFGAESFWRLDAGQSEVAAGWKGARLGFGTRNLWWGPARKNAIVMSNNAGGFPHGFLGTDGPVVTGIGSFEAQWIWGRLSQSDWFDPTVTPTDRFLTGLVASYAPSFLDGLTVGATRVFYGLVPAGGVPLGDYFMVLRGVRKSGLVTPENPTGDDEEDQMLSLFWRWVASGNGFEVYGEWARNDHSWDLTDFVLEPEHTQAYVLGLQKAVRLRNERLLALWVEFTHLERTRTQEVRATPVYYTHYIVTQGYTHRGQVIGAGVGPGGNAQQMGVDLYAPWGRGGLFVQRDVHDNDAYYTYAAANGLDHCCHDVSLRVGGHGLYFVGPFDLSGGLTMTREFNRYFQDDEVWNLNISLSARWRAR
jgi:hypothetical protein